MPTKQASPSLQGIRVALTVAADDPHSPAATLVEREAAPLFYPVAQTLPPDTYEELDSALLRTRQGTVDWLLLTTPCAVVALAQRMAHLEIRPDVLDQIKVAYSGAQTQTVAAALFPAWRSVTPISGSREHMIDAMRLTADDIVLIPKAQRMRANWDTLVAATGAKVLAAPAYRLILSRGGDDLPGLLWGGLVDAVVFVTENSVRHFVVRLKVEGGSLDMLGDVVIACLDDQTAAAARAYDLNPQVILDADAPTDLAEALAQYFRAQPVTH